MSDILIIKSDRNLSARQFSNLYGHLLNQKKNGIIILPCFCDAIAIPEDIEIRMEGGEKMDGD